MNTELDKSFSGGIDVGNTKVMTNRVSMENTVEAMEPKSLLRTCLSGAVLAAGLDHARCLPS